MSTATEKIAEEQAIHAHKVAQKVGDYHSKVASAPLQLTDNPFADIGIFNKLSPEFRNQIYGCLLEDAPQSDSSGPLCPCQLVPGENEHTGAEVYKPLSHHRPLLDLAATCKPFRGEVQNLLFVDYVFRTP